MRTNYPLENCVFCTIVTVGITSKTRKIERNLSRRCAGKHGKIMTDLSDIEIKLLYMRSTRRFNDISIYQGTLLLVKFPLDKGLV